MTSNNVQIFFVIVHILSIMVQILYGTFHCLFILLHMLKYSYEKYSYAGKICPEMFIPYFSYFICSRENSTEIHMLYFQASRMSQIIYDTSYFIFHSLHILKLSPSEVHSLMHSSHMLSITIHSLIKNFIFYFFILYLSCFILQ